MTISSGQGRSIGRYILTLDTYSGTVLPLGDDESVQVALPFKFPYQGVDWTSVWVNSDGNLTFGGPDTDTSDRTVSRFLAGPPRIAPLFADLDPSGFGTGVTGIVMVEDTGNAITVRWVSVPRFGNVFTNSFSVSLEKGGEINMEWRVLRRSGRSVVGVTQGSGVMDPRPTDLSRARKLSAVGTTYEHFLEAVRSPFNVPSLDLYYSTARFKETLALSPLLTLLVTSVAYSRRSIDRKPQKPAKWLALVPTARWTRGTCWVLSMGFESQALAWGCIEALLMLGMQPQAKA